MTLLNDYLSANQITQANIVRKTGKTQSSISRVLNSKEEISKKNTIIIIKAVASLLNVTPGDVLNDLIKLEESTMTFNEDHTFNILTTIWNKDDSIFSDEVMDYDTFSEACVAFNDLIKTNRINERITFDLSVDENIVISATLIDNVITDSYTDNLRELPEDVKPVLLNTAKAYEIKVD